MTTKEQMHKYRVSKVYPSASRLDDLFSERNNDPHMWAYMDAALFGLGSEDFWTVSVGIGPNMMCITQIIVFEDQLGYDMYQFDGVTIFDSEIV